MSVIKLEVITPDAVINKRIINEVAGYIKLRVAKLVDRLEKEVKLWVVSVVKNSPTWHELSTYNDLRLELGIGPAQDVLDKILGWWENTLIINATNVNVASNGIKLVININAIEASYEDVIKIGRYISRGKDGDHEIDWLNWLLTQGANPVKAGGVPIKGYIAHYVNTPKSRTQAMLMFRAKDESVPYYIPDTHQGTINDNFVTRAIAQRQGEFPVLIDRIFKQVLK